MKKIVTHNGNFHADDVFAVATLLIYLEKIGESAKIIRTRDEDLINDGDFVVDVGSIYDEETNRFDHHQESFKEKGFLGIPYSSFGLVWKHFGEAVCENKNAYTKFKENFVTVLDANDSGIDTQIENIKGLNPIDPERFIFSWHPPITERTEEALYKGFIEAVNFAKGFIEREIKRLLAKEELREEFEIVLKNKKNILKTDSLKILILPKPLPWKDFLDEENDFEFVMMQRDDGNWMATGVPVKKHSMKVKSMKKSWLGLRDSELSKKANVEGLVFYHKTGYILVGTTKESVIEALEKF